MKTWIFNAYIETGKLCDLVLQTGNSFMFREKCKIISGSSFSWIRQN